MREDNKISNKQIRALIVSTVIGIGILSLPNRIAMINGRDGSIPIILGGLLMMPIIVVINKIFDLYPDKDFFEIGRTVLGKWIFNIFLLIFLAYNLGAMSFLARNLAELVKAFLLPTTPTEVLIITFILATSYIARDEIQVIGRMAYHTYPVIIGTVIFLLIISLPGIDFTNMLPVFQSNIRSMPTGIKVSFFSYIGFEILLFAIPFSEKKEGNLKFSLLGLGMVIATYVAVFILSLTEYGLHNLQRQTFPALSLIKEVDLPGYFVENLDGLGMALWVIIVFSSMAALYFSAGKILSNLFSTRDHSMFILPIVPIIYIISLIPENPVALDETIGVFVDYSGAVTIVLLPITIYCVGLIKTRREAR